MDRINLFDFNLKQKKDNNLYKSGIHTQHKLDAERVLLYMYIYSLAIGRRSLLCGTLFPAFLVGAHHRPCRAPGNPSFICCVAYYNHYTLLMCLCVYLSISLSVHRTHLRSLLLLYSKYRVPHIFLLRNRTVLIFLHAQCVTSL